MKLQSVLMITLFSTLAFSAQGKVLKTLVKKKLLLSSLSPSVGLSATSIQTGASIGSITPQVGTIIQTENTFEEIAPLSEAIHTDLISDSQLVASVEHVPSSVRVYSYAPQYRTPVYYRETRPVIQRQVYVDRQRNDLRGLTDLIGNIPGIGAISGIKNLIGNALRSPARPTTATASAQLSYSSY